MPNIVDKQPIAEIIIDDAIDKCLDYAIPEEFQGKTLPGMRVKVPVRGSVRQGTVFALKKTSAYSKLASIQEISEKPFISTELFGLSRWISNYYCAPLRKVLKVILPPSIRKETAAKQQLFVKSLLSANELVELCPTIRQKNPLQAQVIDEMLKNPKGVLLSQLLEATKATRSSVDALVKKKVLSCQKVEIDRSILHDFEYFPTKHKKLNDEQQEALDLIKESLNQAIFEVRLLHGVTGSGKTEVYLQAIDHALKMGKGVIFLVPEIALTSQTLERLKGRFLEKIVILHHRLSPGEKRDAWHQIREGKAPIVIGARSAIFSPVPHLGLVIVDEEQEGSYKQTDESPCYHARDVAIMRGKFANATVLLGSATPSLESYHNATTGKYKLSKLTARPDQATMPTVHIIDMKVEFTKAKGFTLFSQALLEEIKKRVALGEQTILFLNRRGYHTSQTCASCAHVMYCPECALSLTFHLGSNILACHLCDYRLFPPPKHCPKCHAEGQLKFKGAGTEMVERSLHAILPDVRTLRLDADTTKHKGSHEQLYKQFRAGKADVLIGTQMIAKGLHFPSVTLVGVLHADSSLHIPDFRASENVYQLLTQVAGRSGRGSIHGQVIIQTHMPDHPVIGLAKEQNDDEFFSQEIKTRELFGYPPFAKLVKISFSGKDEKGVLRIANQIREHLIQTTPPTFELLPVVPCGHAKIKGQFRYQFLIKGRPINALLPLLQKLQEEQKSSIRLFIDVDPLSTFF